MGTYAIEGTIRSLGDNFAKQTVVLSEAEIQWIPLNSMIFQTALAQKLLILGEPAHYVGVSSRGDQSIPGLFPVVCTPNLLSFNRPKSTN